MRSALALPLVSWLLAAGPAHAGELGGDSRGVWGDVSVGLGLGDRPVTPGVGWTVALGGFVGRHDDAFAVGRRWGIGLRARQDLQLADGRRLLRSAMGLDVHRGLDLLVAAVQIGGFAGPWLTTPLDGGTATPRGATLRAYGAATWRAHRFVGLQVRLEAGVDLDVSRPAPVTAAPALALTVGVAWTRPR